MSKQEYVKSIEWALGQIGGADAERVLTEHHLNKGLKALQARKKDSRLALFTGPNPYISKSPNLLYQQPNKNSRVLKTLPSEVTVILLDKKGIYANDDEYFYHCYYKVTDPSSGLTGYFLIERGLTGNYLPGYW